MRKIDKIIIHCAATPEGVNFSVSQIDSWHRQRGFQRCPENQYREAVCRLRQAGGYSPEGCPWARHRPAACSQR